jgi:putative NADPH-quinone reductase
MTSKPRILILYAHPLHQHSRANRRFCDAARTVPNVHLHDLYETYPDFHIDVQHEQALLARSELIVFQHPIQWYSMPSLLKEWVDVVLGHGWAHGQSGNALQGKNFWLVASTGDAEAAYRKDGIHRRPFSDFLPPFEQTALLCGMQWLPPLILHGAHQADDAMLDSHAEEYRQRLVSYPDWPAIQTATGAPGVSTDQFY